jgi:hypothetical protein
VVKLSDSAFVVLNKESCILSEDLTCLAENNGVRQLFEAH